MRVDVDAGAEAIMDALARAQPLVDATGEPGTHVGGMLAQVRDTMTDITGQPANEIAIRDVLAVDTMVPAEVRGGLAGEVALENAVALAAMVRTRPQPDAGRGRPRSPTSWARRPPSAGSRARWPPCGALTTPGIERPVAVLDLGGGSTGRGAARPRRRVRRHARRRGGRAGHQADRRRAGAWTTARPPSTSSAIRWPRWRASSTCATRTARSSSSQEPLPPQVFARVVTLERGRPARRCPRG